MVSTSERKMTDTMSNDPLSPETLTTLMMISLGSSSPTSSSSSSLQTPYDAVAVLGHACMLAVGFRLVGLGEEDRIAATTSAATDNDDTQAQTISHLPHDWNASSTSAIYAFRYAHTQSSMEYLLKINRMGRKAVVMAMGLGDDRTTSFDVAVQDYISESSLPLTSSLSSSADDNGASSDGGATTTTTTTRRMGEMKDRLRQVFISSYRLTDLAMLFKINIIQRIIPGLYKEGYQETLNDTTNPASSQQQQRRQPSSSSSSRHRQDNSSEPRSHLPEPARPYPIHDPLAILQPPRRPAVHPSGEFPPPGFDDEYDILRRPGRGGGEGGPPFERNPLSIGHDDLNPPGLGGPWGAIPPSVGGGGGGMHPTFDDPLFRGGGRRNNPYDPSRPPGARYDPVGPGDGPPTGQLPDLGGDGGPGRRNGGPGGRGGFSDFGSPPNPFGGFGGDSFI